MRAKDKGDAFRIFIDLLEALYVLRAQGLNWEAMGITDELLVGLLRSAMGRKPKTFLETTLEWLKIAHPLPRSTRPDADTDL